MVGKGAQHLVAPLMAVTVVDRLEVVHVQVTHGERVMMAVRQTLLIVQHLHDMTAVEQPGQIVADRQLPALPHHSGQLPVVPAKSPAQRVDAAPGNGEASAHRHESQPLQQRRRQLQLRIPVLIQAEQRQPVSRADHHRQQTQSSWLQPERQQQQQREIQQHHGEAAVRGVYRRQQQHGGQYDPGRKRQRRFLPGPGQTALDHGQVGQHQTP